MLPSQLSEVQIVHSSKGLGALQSMVGGVPDLLWKIYSYVTMGKIYILHSSVRKGFSYRLIKIKPLLKLIEQLVKYIIMGRDKHHNN